jgi:glyoxylase-like metal-dependent hydrolase (beta-lactamase superfamily II)
MNSAKKITDGIFMIEVPLPGNPLRAINSYVIIGTHGNLIIDTGMNMPECLSAIKKGIEELELDLKKTAIFLTHMHADHTGLSGILGEECLHVYFSKVEFEFLFRFKDDYWDRILNFLIKHGFPEEDAKKAVKNHPGQKYIAKGNIDFKFVSDGDRIDLGNFVLQCIHTPGHTPGHICLYESDKKILFSGDHILEDISPIIAVISDEDSPLKDYLNSLDKVFNLEVNLVCPGHRRVFTEYRKRIAELKEHHRRRLDEILKILASGNRNAYEVASMMTWDINYKSWQEFPVLQKWFAVGEAIAHLKHLEEKGLIQALERNSHIEFALQSKC